MADFNAGVIPLLEPSTSIGGIELNGEFVGNSSVALNRRYYRMRGIDITCPAWAQPAYVYWVVADTPDAGGARFSGSLPCGLNPLTDLSNIITTATWESVVT